MTDWTVELVYERKKERFRELCKAHDLTYAFSDDHRKWVAGEASWKMINEFSKSILPDEAAEIWNEIVDTKISEDGVNQFYTTAERWLSIR